MKLNKLKLTRITLRLSLGLMLMGFTVFLTVFALQLSPVQSPVFFWEMLMRFGFVSGVLGFFLLLLTILTFIPKAINLSSNHFQAHGQTYSGIFSAISVGLVGLFSATTTLAKTHGSVVSEMMDTDSSDSGEGMLSGNSDSVWSETEADIAGPGSYEWNDRYL